MDKTVFQSAKEYAQFCDHMEITGIAEPVFYPCVMVYQYDSHAIKSGVYDVIYIYFSDFRCYDRKRGENKDTSELSYILYFVETELNLEPGILRKKSGDIDKSFRKTFLQRTNARCIAVFLMKRTGASWAQIGRAINRDHSTASAAYVRYIEYYKYNPDFKETADKVITAFADHS